MAACLIGDVVFPMQDAQLEVLTQIGTDDLDVVAALHGRDVIAHHGFSIGGGQGNAGVLEIAVVLNVLHAQCNLGVCVECLSPLLCAV